MITPYEQAARLLPPAHRRASDTLSAARRLAAEEFRLRAGQFFSVTFSDGEVVPDASLVTSSDDIVHTMNNATQESLHTVLEKVRNGYLTVEGGHRIGMCGQAVVSDGCVTHIKNLSSLCIRIARQVHGAANGVVDKLFSSGRALNTLIISPPGLGKTTLLRDLVRQISNGSDRRPALRVSVADERGELAGCFWGRAQLDVGAQTDVMDGAPKAEAAMILLRGMNPQVLAMDEIASTDDVAALRSCMGCGVSVLATAHAQDREDLERRETLRTVLPMFDRLITIGLSPRRTYEVQAL